MTADTQAAHRRRPSADAPIVIVTGHERRRPQHDRQRPRGPRLVRRRQPAAAAARAPGRAARRGRARSPRRTASRSPSSSTSARVAFFADLADAIAELGRAASVPASSSSTPPTRRSSAASRACAARTRCRATAGSSTASQRERELLARPARRRPTSSSTPPASTCTSCAPSSSLALRRRPARPAAHRGHVVRLQVRPAARRRRRLRLRFLPNPYWVPELRPLTGRDDAGQRVRHEPAGRRRVPRPRTATCSHDDRRLRARGEALRHRRRRLHRRQAPVAWPSPRRWARGSADATGVDTSSSTATWGGSDRDDRA